MQLGIEGNQTREEEKVQERSSLLTLTKLPPFDGRLWLQQNGDKTGIRHHCPVVGRIRHTKPNSFEAAVPWGPRAMGKRWSVRLTSLVFGLTADRRKTACKLGFPHNETNANEL
jgi:hypothetical protein